MPGWLAAVPGLDESSFVGGDDGLYPVAAAQLHCEPLSVGVCRIDGRPCRARGACRDPETVQSYLLTGFRDRRCPRAQDAGKRADRPFRRAACRRSADLYQCAYRRARGGACPLRRPAPRRWHAMADRLHESACRTNVPYPAVVERKSHAAPRIAPSSGDELYNAPAKMNLTFHDHSLCDSLEYSWRSATSTARTYRDHAFVDLGAAHRGRRAI